MGLRYATEVSSGYGYACDLGCTQRIQLHIHWPHRLAPKSGAPTHLQREFANCMLQPIFCVTWSMSASGHATEQCYTASPPGGPGAHAARSADVSQGLGRVVRIATFHARGSCKNWNTSGIVSRCCSQYLLLYLELVADSGSR